MKLKDVRFEVESNQKLNKTEKKYILELYQELFKKMYGSDIICDYFKNLNTNKFNLYDVSNLLEEDLSFVLIYKNNDLVGAGRIKKINKKEISIPDVAISLDEKEQRNIWKMTISFLEDYLKKLEYTKMYVEVPLKDPFLLIRANELGFKEDPEDIKFNNNFTYVLNKVLIEDE